MTVDTTGRENLEFWARVEAEEHEREREIERQRELDRDGLDYINPDANCGANDPSGQSVESEYQLQGGYDGVFWDVCGISRTRAGLARVEWRCPHPRHRIVRVTSEVVEVVEVLDGRGHA